MKVLLIDNVCDPQKPAASGHSDMVWAMARHLRQRHHEVTIVAPYAHVPFHQDGVEIVRFPLLFRRRNVVSSSLEAVLAAASARKIAADIYHATDAFSAGAAALLGVDPVVFTAPGNVHQRLHSGIGLDPSAALGYRVWSRFAATRARAIVCTSQDMAYWWRVTGAKSNQIYNLPLGVDTSTYHPLGKAADLAPVTLLTVARLAVENNIDLMLEAVVHPLLAGSRFNLIIVGDGPLKAALQEKAVALGIDQRIQWRGFVDPSRLPAVYHEADLFFFTRLDGAPPRVVLQALASGLPVLGFSASGLDSYVEHGVTGFLAQRGDMEMMARHLRTCVTDTSLIRRMGVTASTVAVATFEWSKVVEGLEGVYRSIS